MKYLYDAIVVGGFLLAAGLLYYFYRRDMKVRPLDPLKHCDLYKETKKCAHVDGFLCNVDTCSSLKDYREVKLVKKETYV